LQGLKERVRRCPLDTQNQQFVMFWRVDTDCNVTRSEESVDFSLYGFVKIFALLKLWKTKDKIM